MRDSAITEKLQSMVETSDGAVGGALVGFEGKPVAIYARQSGPGVDAVASDFAAVVDQVRETAAILSVGALREMTVHSDKLVFVVHVVDQRFFLLLALSPQGNHAQGRHRMRMVRSDLRALL